MKIVKPIAYEFRNARAEKSNRASDWNVEDCLYQAAELINKSGDSVDCAMVVWRERGKDRNKISWRYSGPEDAQSSLILEFLRNQ